MIQPGPNILILSAYDVGGASIAAIRLHLGLLSIGANSRLLTLNKSHSNIPDHFQYKPVNGLIEKIGLKFRERNIHKQKVSLQLPESESLSGEFSFPIAPFDVTDHPLWEWADIVNLHWVNEWIGFEPLFSRSGSKKLVWTMHDMHVFTGGCHYAHHCTGFELECTNCPLLVKSNMPQLAHYFWKMKRSTLLLNKPDLFITAPSQWMISIASRSSLLSQFPSMAIANSLDTNTFRPMPKDSARNVLNIPHDKIVLLSVIQSLTDRRKGFEHLIEALNFIPNPENYVLCTVGNWNIEAPAFKVNHIHLGSLSDEKLMAIVYNSVDIFVHPAIEDNYPNVVLEALCCGIPVAGFCIGGMPEMIKDGENGYLSKKIDSESLGLTILATQNLIGNTVEIYKDAHKKYALEVQARNFFNLFNKILANIKQD